MPGRGQGSKSKELTAAFDLIVLFLVLKIFISFVGGNLIGLFSTVYKKMPDFKGVTGADFICFGHALFK